jgi:hypothetical protein
MECQEKTERQSETMMGASDTPRFATFCVMRGSLLVVVTLNFVRSLYRVALMNDSVSRQE